MPFIFWVDLVDYDMKSKNAGHVISLETIRINGLLLMTDFFNLESGLFPHPELSF